MAARVRVKISVDDCVEYETCGSLAECASGANGFLTSEIDGSRNKAKEVEASEGAAVEAADVGASGAPGEESASTGSKKRCRVS